MKVKINRAILILLVSVTIQACSQSRSSTVVNNVNYNETRNIANVMVFRGFNDYDMKVVSDGMTSFPGYRSMNAVTSYQGSRKYQYVSGMGSDELTISLRQYLIDKGLNSRIFHSDGQIIVEKRYAARSKKSPGNPSAQPEEKKSSEGKRQSWEEAPKGVRHNLGGDL